MHFQVSNFSFFFGEQKKFPNFTDSFFMHIQCMHNLVPHKSTDFWGFYLTRPINMTYKLYMYTSYHFCEQCVTLSKELGQPVRFLHFSLQPLLVFISDLSGKGNKDEEDPESLEGHQDGVDVGQRQQCLHLHYQHS